MSTNEPPPGGTPPPSPPPAAPPPPPPSAPVEGGTAAADLGTRIGARAIDFIILMIVYLFVFVPMIFAAMFADLGGGMMSFSGTGFVIGLIVTAFFVGYFVLMDVYAGRTLGKMMLGLFVRAAATGERVSFEQAVKRNAWMFLGVLPVIGWLLQLAAAIYIMVTINNDPQRRGWHDQFAGTTVTKG